MLRGFYIASNGMINQQRVMNNISNNIANVQTAGYKSDTVVQNTFKRELLLLNGARKNTTGTIEYKYTEMSKTDLSQGSFKFTESPLDVAIQGSVYFNLQSDNGDVLLTRNGQFSIDDEGYLSLDGGGRVMGENGPIMLGTSDFSIGNDGSIFSNDVLVDKLELTYIAEADDVQKQGENTFIKIGEIKEEIPEGTEFSIIQGAYERSNVDISAEMTKSIVAQRSFEAISQALQMIDTMNQKAVTELAKI